MPPLHGLQPWNQLGSGGFAILGGLRLFMPVLLTVFATGPLGGLISRPSPSPCGEGGQGQCGYNGDG
uniref:Uncharacterized protein n=1 Tax=mine drainage metagenome TaxID=410659 RepID=E6Q8W3_9ZZZZ